MDGEGRRETASDRAKGRTELKRERTWQAGCSRACPCAAKRCAAKPAAFAAAAAGTLLHSDESCTSSGGRCHAALLLRNGGRQIRGRGAAQLMGIVHQNGVERNERWRAGRASLPEVPWPAQLRLPGRASSPPAAADLVLLLCQGGAPGLAVGLLHRQRGGRSTLHRAAGQPWDVFGIASSG